MKALATTCALSLGAALSAGHALAQTYPVTPGQQATAQQVAQRGVPLSALAANAPERYTVRKGDTLWGISGLFLRQPWRWPELWGMNLQAIANPHLIYPGQTLYLERSNGYARLTTSRSGNETVKLSPRVRSESLRDLALPTLRMHLIEPFLAEPLVVQELTLQQAPRLIAASDERLLMSPGDEVYARGPAGTPFAAGDGDERLYRVFRDAKPLKDPITQEVLGYEAQYLGKVELLAAEAPPNLPDGAAAEPAAANTPQAQIPATLHVTQIKEEMRAGDRLLPEPARQYRSFVPHAPQDAVEARVVSLYTSNAMRYGTENQVISINKGEADGMEPGMVLSLISQGRQIVDKTEGRKETVQLPDQANGTGMVFRVFDRVSYVLVMDTRRGVTVGDKLVPPQ
ncbi:LysM peptidoglycan-binding domain-containing protein [Comamonas nitrativorans]|uniref:LysM peptidoglycan-binding domain-containing protein n=1 Tax=Comamonas nitrativorans TaxID=108437 RepID=A0ABV9GWE5_9BURK